jgi:hypothetical protein
MFLLALLVASALLAGWFFVRFPRLAPVRERGITLALVGTFAVFGFGPQAIKIVGQPLGAVPAALLIAVPACTYLFLAAIWVMAYVKRAIEPFLK